MNTLDIILILPLLFGAYNGYRRGLLITFISLVAFILAIVGGFKLLHVGMEIISGLVGGLGSLLPFVAFIVIFVLIILLLHILGKVLKKFIDLTLLGSVDNLMGAIFGLLKWAFGISALIWIAGSLNYEFPGHYTNGSLIYGPVKSVAPAVGGWLAVIFPFLENIGDSLKSLLSNVSP